MAVNLRRSRGLQAVFLSVFLGCIVLTASAVAASNQETTAEPSMVTFTFEGEFMFLAQMEFEVFDSNQNSVLRVNQDENTNDHQLILAPGQYNVEARANAGPLSIRMDSMEFDSQEYNHVTLTVQYVLVTEVVSVLALVSLTLSLLRVSRRLFGRFRRKKSTSISSTVHVEPTDDMLPEQDPKSDTDLEDALKEHRELFSDRLHTRGDFLPPPQGGPTSLSDVIDYYARQDEAGEEKDAELERSSAEEERLRKKWLRTKEGKEAAESELSNLIAHSLDAEIRRRMKDGATVDEALAGALGTQQEESGPKKGSKDNPWSEEETREILEWEKKIHRHKKSTICGEKPCKEKGFCLGIPEVSNPFDYFGEKSSNWSNLDFESVKTGFEIYEGRPYPSGTTGGRGVRTGGQRQFYTLSGPTIPKPIKIIGGDLNYYYFGMAYAYNCRTWEETEAIIHLWNKVIQRGSDFLESFQRGRSMMTGSYKVSKQMLAAAKAGYDEERRRDPDRCNNVLFKVREYLEEEAMDIYEEVSEFFDKMGIDFVPDWLNIID